MSRNPKDPGGNPPTRTARGRRYRAAAADVPRRLITGAASKRDPTTPLGPGFRPKPRDGETPRRLGPYRLLEVLGEGGMGTVYLAEETEHLKRRVAVKWIRSALTGPAALERFAAERQALARMNHPSIAQVFAAGATDDGRPYIVMEYVQGPRITKYCARKKPPLPELLDLFAALARGLLHAHRKGIIHRDIKPSNVLVAEDPDDGPTPKLIDFGLAKLLDATVQLTRDGDVLGTLAYMSPEQLRGGRVDHRTDVYSYGLLIRELLTGARPDAPGTSPDAVPLPAGAPDVLADVLDRCLASDPNERYDDFAALLEDLESARAALAEAALREEATAGEPAFERLAESLEELIAAGLSDDAERLLGLFEDVSRRSPGLAAAAVAEACRLRDVHRRGTKARRRLEAAADAYREAALLAGGVLGGGPEEVDDAFVDVIAAYREALAMDPDTAPPEDLCRLGDAYLQLAEAGSGELEAADDAYRHAAGAAAARYGRALVALIEGGMSEAVLTEARQLTAQAPGTAAAWCHLGNVLYRSRDYPQISLFGRDKLREAETAYEKALELFPDGAAVHFGLGLVRLARGDEDGAAASFERVWDLDPEGALRGGAADARELAAAAAAGEVGPWEVLPFSASSPDG